MAGRRYSIIGETPAGTTLTILQAVGVTTTRAWINDIIIGSDSNTPADVATEFQVIRGTVSGTGTGVTPKSFDPSHPASLLTGCERGTFSGQTKTASSGMLMIALNQRATFRWVALEGSEIIVPHVADEWVGLESIASGGTNNQNATIAWIE